MHKFQPFHLFCKFASIVGLGLALSACASGARVGAMTSGVVPDTIVKSNAPVRQAIEIGKVDGGSETIPVWKSEASTENFREALKQSLELNVLLANTEGRYILDATIIDLDQPLLGGFDMEVTARVHYTLTDAKTKAVVFDQTITTPHTTDFTEALIGMERLRLANEGALRDNIKAFITAVVSKPGLGR